MIRQVTILNVNFVKDTKVTERSPINWPCLYLLQAVMLPSSKLLYIPFQSFSHLAHKNVGNKN